MGDATTKTNPAVRRSPLAAVFKAMGAPVENEHGWETVPRITSPSEEAWAVRHAVGLGDVSRLPKFEARGNDLSTFPDLSDAAAVWYPRRNQILLASGVSARDAVRQRLDQYAEAVSEHAPVYVTDVTPVYAALLLAGPRSRAVLRKLIDVDVSDSALPNLSCVQTGIHHVYALVARQDLPDCPAYLILSGREYGQWLWETVMHAGHEFHIEAFGSRAQETLGAA